MPEDKNELNIRVPVIVLPSQDVKDFLMDLIVQSNYPGKLVEFVAHVKFMVANSKIDEQNTL